MKKMTSKELLKKAIESKTQKTFEKYIKMWIAA